MARWPFALLPLITWAAPLRAQPSEEAVRFQYAAPPACPDADNFIARVRERTQRGRLAEPGELARTFGIAIAADAEGFAGDIEFLDDGGARVARHLHGEQCDAVVSSLALITALALDATLREEEEPTPPAPQPEAAPPPAPPERSVVAKPETKAPPAPVREPAVKSARVGVGAGYGTALHALDFGVAPRLALIAQLDWRRGFSLRIAAHYDWHALTVASGRRARLRLLGVETSACPWRLGWAELAITPCATLDLGSLRGEGQLGDKLTTPGGETILWAAVGAELRLAWEPNAPVWIELRAAATVPLRASYEFRFSNPSQLVYEVPYFAGAGSTVVGVRFW